MNKQEVKLVPDFPASHDEFGPHQRIATAIQNLVTKEDGGRSIALIGTWGGGKSTVINLLKNEASNELAVFVFDAWSHEGDPLRRTFLEKLIAFLSAKNWITDKAKWKETLLELSQSVEKNEIITAPALTTKGVIGAGVLFLGAIGISMLGGGPSDGKYYIWITIAFVFGSLPLLATGLYWAYLSRSKDEGDSMNLLRGLLNKERDKTTTSTIKSPEPTSIEFQSCFKKLASETLTGRKKLLIVIDNLDRVDTEDALKLWSSMRTFVDFEEGERPIWANKVWNLAAFDDDGIKKLWRDKEIADQNSSESGTKNVASAFLDKTFQIRFRVPKPLLSDWREYLNKQLQTAFPNGGEEDFFRIARFYATLRRGNGTPTPRDLKVFVNQIGAVVRTTPDDDIPIVHCALYALLSETSWKAGDELPQDCKDLLWSLIPGGWIENSAAMHFNMPKKEAVEILLREQVETAIANLDVKLFQNAIQHSGAEYAVEQFLENRIPHWLTNEPQMVGRCSYVLIPNTTGAFKTRSCKSLASSIGKLGPITEIEKESGIGFSLLIGESNDESNDLTKNLLLRLSGTSPFEGKTDPAQVDPARWIKGMEAVIEGLVGLDKSKIVLSHLTVCKDAQYYWILCAALGMHCNPDNWQFFQPGIPPNAVIDMFKQQGQTGGLSSTYTRGMQVIRKIGEKWNWSGFWPEITATLKNPNTTANIEHLTSLLTILMMFRNEPEVKREIELLINQGWIFHHLSMQASKGQNQKPFVVAFVLANNPDLLNLAIIGQIQPHGHQGMSMYRNLVTNPDDAFISNVITHIQEFDCVRNLMVDPNAPAGFSKSTRNLILRKVCNNPDVSKFLPVNLFIDQFPFFNSILDKEELSNAVGVYKDSGLYVGLLNSNLKLENTRLYIKALDGCMDDEFIGKVTQFVKSQTKDAWLQTLAGKNELALLVIALQKLSVHLDIGHTLQDALDEFASSITQAIPEDSIKEDLCHALIEGMSDDQRITFKLNIRDRILRTESNIENLLRYFGSETKDAGIINEKADEMVRNTFRQILERSSLVELQWFREQLQNNSKIFKSCHSTTVEGFKTRVKELKITDQNIAQLIEEIKALCDAI